MAFFMRCLSINFLKISHTYTNYYMLIEKIQMQRLQEKKNRVFSFASVLFYVAQTCIVFVFR